MFLFQIVVDLSFKANLALAIEGDCLGQCSQLAILGAACTVVGCFLLFMVSMTLVPAALGHAACEFPVTFALLGLSGQLQTLAMD